MILIQLPNPSSTSFPILAVVVPIRFGSNLDPNTGSDSRSDLNLDPVTDQCTKQLYIRLLGFAFRQIIFPRCPPNIITPFKVASGSAAADGVRGNDPSADKRARADSNARRPDNERPANGRRDSVIKCSERDKAAAGAPARAAGLLVLTAPAPGRARIPY
ncbi:hypothetical protein EVAR_50082_1 [Eumeta japonica]|uniref:Uncharacterized protein n=1 Tax=Eumeta variegata TaxID=151549 RepID=A0A4C1ZSU0_EUMVA|nr:hypothetical protein EVAR_50082_1 [Eumeta japonica]